MYEKKKNEKEKKRRKIEIKTKTIFKKKKNHTRAQNIRDGVTCKTTPGRLLFQLRVRCIFLLKQENNNNNINLF